MKHIELVIQIVLLSFWVLSIVAPGKETLPPVQDDKVPQTFEELWAGYDPRAEPLKVEVLKEWEEDRVVLKILRYRIGVFKGQPVLPVTENKDITFVGGTDGYLLCRGVGYLEVRSAPSLIDSKERKRDRIEINLKRVWYEMTGSHKYATTKDEQTDVGSVDNIHSVSKCFGPKQCTFADPSGCLEGL